MLASVVTIDRGQYVLAIVGKCSARRVVAKLAQVPPVDEEVKDRLELSDVCDELVHHKVA